MSKNKTMCCYENGIFGWTGAFSGTVYAHMKSLNCRLTTDKNKVSLHARGLQLLDEYIMAVCKSRSDEPKECIIEEKGPMKTVLKVSKESISLEIVVDTDMQAAKIEIKDLQAFGVFVQNLNKDSYDKLTQKGLPTHGTPTAVWVNQEKEKKSCPNEDKKEVSNEADDDDRDLCKICLENELNILVMPCKHLCLCIVCSDKVAKLGQKCPMCRTPINELVKVYKC